MLARARAARNEAAPFLFKQLGVVGVGVGFKEVNGERTDEPCVVVSVIEKRPRIALSRDEVIAPVVMGGVKTDVVETGVIRAFQVRQASPCCEAQAAVGERTDKWRPALGGVSIGHKDITAGTLGCLVTKDEAMYILSNNHVLANCNKGQYHDAILQPGSYDGGTISDSWIAELYDYVPLNVITASDCPTGNAVAKALNALAKLWGSKTRLYPFAADAGVNLVDAAIALPLTVGDVQRTVLGIGTPLPSATAPLGSVVKKSGRTTGLTEGIVTQVDMTVTVQFPPDGVAIFIDQIAGDLLCEPGDSGSLVVNESNHAVGLLFAGGAGVTIFCRAQNVEALLGVKFG